MRLHRKTRAVAIGIPSHNEAGRIGLCIEHLNQMLTDERVSGVRIVVLANNCTDATVEAAAAVRPALGRTVEVRHITLAPDRAHAGWARRLAMEAAAASLESPFDLLMSTDADTLIARDWLVRTLDYIDRGWDAVAGQALLYPRELRRLPAAYRTRFAAIRRYNNAVTFLKARRANEEAWPRHFYEGGASIALTRAAYARIGGAPTPCVGEDKALFDAVRRSGGRVRHPTDVRVFTSPRLDGRARDGAADTLARWGSQGERDPIFGLESLNAVMGAVPMAQPELTFATLAGETAKARRLVQLGRRQAETHDVHALQDEDRRRARAPWVQAVMRRA
jgi:GT2 family glycosyltransferase